jgi:DNA-binding transcriptional regulator YhcF (GntR family)
MSLDLDRIEKAIEKAIPSTAARATYRKTGRKAATGFSVTVDFKEARLELTGEWIESPSSAALKDRAAWLRQLSQGDPRITPIIMAPYLTESQRQLLIDAGVGFIDLAGNAHVEARGVYVSKVSPRPSGPKKIAAPNPFSDKASLVVRQLLSQRNPVGVRELAAKIDVTPGYVSKVLSRLDTLGYLSKDQEQKVNVRDPKSILQDWAAVYDYTKNRMTGYFCRARGVEIILDKLQRAVAPEGYALTAQAGAHLVAPYAAFDRVDIYVPSLRVVEGLAAALGLEPVGKGANVVLWEPYLKRSVFFGCREVRGVRVVSDVQLYLDLVKYPLRGAEQAGHLYQTLLMPLLEPSV